MIIPISQRYSSRIRPWRSSSTYIATLFSILLMIAMGLFIYVSYQFSMGTPPERWLLQSSLGLILSIAIGLFIVGFYATKRINRIVETAESIMHTGDMSQRIPVYQTGDDLSTLSHTLNRMLNEIETLVHGIRTVSDNIAHDLRHPLAHLRNQLEEARATIGKNTSEEQTHTLTALIHECDTILNTFNGLLRISNIESAKRHSGFAPVELHRLLGDVIELYEPIAQERSITITLSGDKPSLIGDKDLLFQATANLIDNAIKFTRDNGTIDITVTRGKRAILLEIDDEGHGIPPEHRSKVFNRFYRVESCRSTPGSGLGLSLVRAIVELHKGTIALSEGKRSGLLVRITL